MARKLCCHWVKHRLHQLGTNFFYLDRCMAWQPAAVCIVISYKLISPADPQRIHCEVHQSYGWHVVGIGSTVFQQGKPWSLLHPGCHRPGNGIFSAFFRVNSTTTTPKYASQWLTGTQRGPVGYKTGFQVPTGFANEYRHPILSAKMMANVP